MATQKAESLFEHSESVCKECRRNLPPDYPGEVCPACKERILFSQVKDFILEKILHLVPCVPNVCVNQILPEAPLFHPEATKKKNSGFFKNNTNILIIRKSLIFVLFILKIRR